MTGISACILAAGFSRRMGRPKPLLPIGGDTFLYKIVKTIERAGIGKIGVVISSPIIKEAHGDLDVVWIYNPEPQAGPLRSFQLFLREFNESEGAFMVPVDHPLVTRETFSKLMHAFTPDKIFVPVHRGKRGHPPLFGRRFYEDLLEAPLDEGARYVIHKRKESVVEVEVDDGGILININTPEDLKKIENSSQFLP